MRQDRSELLERLSEALDEGKVSLDDLERLLATHGEGPERRRTTAAVLYALGEVVVFGGLAIAYGTIYGDLPSLAQLITPFLFPAAAFATCAFLARRANPAWQVDLAGFVGYSALVGAFAAVATAFGWADTSHGAATVAAVGALTTGLAAGGLYQIVGSFRLIVVGLPLALAVLVFASMYAVGLIESGLYWVLLGEAAAAAVAGGLLSARRRLCCSASVWAVLISYAALYGAMVSQDYDFAHLTVWHGILGAVVVAALLVAGALDFGWLLWLGAAGGVAWLVMIAIVVGSATSAALAVVLAGVGLIGLGLLVARMRRAGAAASR